MQFNIDVTQNIFQQFAAPLGVDPTAPHASMTSELGKGQIHQLAFPNQLELYHFSFQLKTPFHVHSQNPPQSEWLLLNINLSKAVMEKTVNQQEIQIQRYLPSGILFYTPETEVYSVSPPGVAFEIALVRFHRSFLAPYLPESLQLLSQADRAILYEDLDYQSEKLIWQALDVEQSFLQRHADLLGFLSIFLDKLKKRESEERYEHLHPQDVKRLFLASAHLRDPLTPNIPSIEELSRIAGMGTTKFKTTFKQVFGRPPKRYHQKIRMEYAREQLASKQKSPSELSYELGYSHPSKFTNAYKKEFGELPSQVV